MCFGGTVVTPTVYSTWGMFFVDLDDCPKWKKSRQLNWMMGLLSRGLCRCHLLGPVLDNTAGVRVRHQVITPPLFYPIPLQHILIPVLIVVVFLLRLHLPLQLLAEVPPLRLPASTPTSTTRPTYTQC